MLSRFAALTAALFVILPTPALASNESAEFWLNPSVSFDLDDNTGAEIETAQRFRDADDGRVDTYFVRFWLNQNISNNVTLSGAVERRINDGGSNETRLIQQMTTKHGILRTRLRLEQRLVDNADRMGLRLNPRLGVALPLDDAGRWSFKSDAELFLTLRANNVGGDEGLTAFRTQIGFDHKIDDHVSISAVYLRQQDLRDGRPDEVGHVPVIGIEYSF